MYKLHLHTQQSTFQLRFLQSKSKFLMKQILLLVLIGPLVLLLFAEGQEFGGYVDALYIVCIVYECIVCELMYVH